METQYLKTLRAVLELGSFSKAAGELCITQSAVSQRIKLLEERLGFPLVDRSGQLVAPTEAGRIVNKKAEQILLLERELESELQGLGARSRLSLCSTPTFGIVYLPMVLNRFFLANSGDVDFKFVLNTPERSLKGLLGNEFDIAVIEHWGELTAAGARIAPLPADELIFISAPALALSGPQLSLEELLRQRLIARREGCSSRCLLQDNLQRCGKTFADFNGMIIYDDLHITIQTVLAGRGIAFVSRSLVSDLLRKGELVGHTVAGFEFSRSRTVLVNGRRSDEPVIRDFLTSIFAVFADR